MFRRRSPGDRQTGGAAGDNTACRAGAGAEQLRPALAVTAAGFVDAFERMGTDQYMRIAHVATADGARTGLFVPEWKELFVAAPHRGGRVAQILVYRTQ